MLDTKYALKAHVYHAVIAAKHHFFIGYAVYHPMDWKAGFGHESDFEGLLLVVERQGDDKWGSILAAETLAHDQIYQYTNHIDVRNREQNIDAGLSTRDNLNGRQGMHPEVIIEAKGHGIFGFGHRVQPAPTVVQHYPGDAAEEEYPAVRTTTTSPTSLSISSLIGFGQIAGRRSCTRSRLRTGLVQRTNRPMHCGCLASFRSTALRLAGRGRRGAGTTTTTVIPYAGTG